MIARAITLFLLLSINSVSAATAQDCTPYRYHESSSSDDIPTISGFLLELKPAASPASYVFGTYHAADTEILARWSKTALLLALRSTRVLISERDLTKVPDLALQQLPEQENLRTLLANHEGLYPKIESILQGQLKLNDVERLKPWFAAALLNQVAAMPRRRDEQMIDSYLAEIAAKLDLPQQTLEQFSDIAAYYENYFSQQDHVQLLWEAVCNQELLADLTQQQTAAYAANDVAGLYRLMQRYDGPDQTLSEKIVDVFVRQRNAEFWRQLWPEIERGGALIAIGSLHVFGDGGLLEQLREADQVVTVRVLDLAKLDFDFVLTVDDIPTLTQWTMSWIQRDSSPSVFADLRIQRQSESELQQRLCPGRSCKVETSYLPASSMILVADPIYARLLASTETPDYILTDLGVIKTLPSTTDIRQAYADSLLVRELTRHLLYQDRDIEKYLSKQEKQCLKNAILHRASKAQAAYLRQRNATATAHWFPLDPRCPR